MYQKKAKKSFGQHFLINEAITEEIANSLQSLKEFPRLLEVGPGQGVLTKYLLQKDVSFKAVEADRDMISVLLTTHPTQAESFIEHDILKVNFQEIFDGEQFCVIGNFPYNISSQIVFKMVENRALVPEMVGMFQKEMADRIVAPHGSRTYGVISVLTQAYYRGETLLAVPPESFNPPPKVNSSVIRLVRKERGIDCDPKLFRSVVKLAFSQRRKMLRNTMKSMIDNPEILASPHFMKRPEHLSLEEFVELTKLVEKNRKI